MHYLNIFIALIINTIKISQIINIKNENFNNNNLLELKNILRKSYTHI